MSSEQSSYEVLGLRPSASTDEVKEAYRKLAKRWHPDRYKGGGKRADMDKARAERKMRECAEAKEVLAKQLQCGEGGSKRGRRGRG